MNTSLALELLDQGELGGDWAEDAQGFGALETARGGLPLKAMDVQGKITGLLAHVALEQTFVNVFEDPLEATYIFPLPPQAAVTSFRMEVAGRIVRGVLKERGEAREVYEEAIASGQRAAIAEEDRADVFSMQVGNLLPGEHARLRMTMTFPLACRDGEVTFRFPLVVAPRYIPGTPLSELPAGDGVATDTDAVPDASRISPPVLLKGYPNPIQLALSLDIDGGDIPIDALKASLHTLLVGQQQRRLSVSLQPGERLDRDFILRYAFGGDEVAPTLQLAPDHVCRPHWEQREAGVSDDEPTMTRRDLGTYALTLTPPLLSSSHRKPRDIVFALDRSGSMMGWKMVVARRAVAQMIDTLHPHDQFQVLAFDTIIEYPDNISGCEAGAMIKARRKHRLLADEYLSTLDARGGTEMAGPLLEAADLLNGGAEGRDRVLVLVTDGQVGNEDQILKTLSKRCQHLRIFTLGIDTAVNAGFLERLAALGGGACELVESDARLEEAFARIQRLIETPVLSELSIELDGVELLAGSQCPRRLPDLFAGVPLHIMGRYRGSHEGAAVIKAKDALGNRWSHRVFGQTSDNPSIPTVWARQQIRMLEDEIAANARHRPDAEGDILNTSLQFGVLSRFTAFVAVDEEKAVKKPSQPLHHVVQAVESPAGWTMNDGPALSAGDHVAEEKAEYGRYRSESSVRDAKPEPILYSSTTSKNMPVSPASFGEVDPSPKLAKGGRGASQPQGKKTKLIKRKASTRSKPDAASFGGGGGSAAGMGGGGSSHGGGAPGASQGPGGTSERRRRSGARLQRDVLPVGKEKERVARRAHAPRKPKPVATPAPAPMPTRVARPGRAPRNEMKTQAGIIKAKLGHLSPEEIQGRGATPQTDQHALGLILFELLAGHPLFQGASELLQLQAILNGPDEALFSTPEMTPFQRIFSMLLAQDPHDRYEHMSDVVMFLNKLRRREFNTAPMLVEDAWRSWLLERVSEERDEQLAQRYELLGRDDLPADGYVLAEKIGQSYHAEHFLAARKVDGVPKAYFARRAHQHMIQEPDRGQLFLTEGGFVHEGAICPEENIVTSDGEYCQISPYVMGVDLQHLLLVLRKRQETVPAGLALWVATQIAMTLRDFHDLKDQGGNHYDMSFPQLEPRRVLLGFDGKVYLTRFGPMPEALQVPMRRAVLVDES